MRGGKRYSKTGFRINSMTIQAFMIVLAAAAAAAVIMGVVAFSRQTVLDEELEAHRRNTTDVTNDTPVVLTEWLGAGTLEQPKFLAYNRKTGRGTFSGAKRERLSYFQENVTTEFWWSALEQYGSGYNKRGSLLRYLIQQGSGESLQGPPDFFVNSIYEDCKTALTLVPDPSTYFYVSKTGNTTDRSDPDNWHKVKFDDTAVIYIDPSGLNLAISAAYATQVAAEFNVTLSEQANSVALDMGFFFEEALGPLSLDLESSSAYEANFTALC